MEDFGKQTKHCVRIIKKQKFSTLTTFSGVILYYKPTSSFSCLHSTPQEDVGLLPTILPLHLKGTDTMLGLIIDTLCDFIKCVILFM